VCIVVVEDEPGVRDVLCQVLKDEGYEVLSFDNPGPVIHLKDTEEHPELFLLDIMLPDMNGIALAARLRDDGFDETPKVAISASREMLHAAEESHLFDAAMSKPFELNDLVSTVQRLASA
jgi:two-component system OmpR family response regulator